MKMLAKTEEELTNAKDNVRLGAIVAKRQLEKTPDPLAVPRVPGLNTQIGSGAVLPSDTFDPDRKPREVNMTLDAPIPAKNKHHPQPLL